MNTDKTKLLIRVYPCSSVAKCFSAFRGTLVKHGGGSSGPAKFPVFRIAGGNLRARLSRAETAHARARNARRVLPLRQRRQLHQSEGRAPRSAHFRPAGRGAGAGAGGPGAYPSRQAIPQAHCAHLCPPLPPLPQSPRRPPAGPPGQADPRTQVRLRAQRRAFRSRRNLRGPQCRIFRWSAGPAATRLEPRRVAQYVGAFRSLAQRHHHQPRLRSPDRAPSSSGICNVPRNAAPALSRGSYRRAAKSAYQGIPRSGKEIPALEGRQRTTQTALVGQVVNPPVAPARASERSRAVRPVKRRLASPRALDAAVRRPSRRRSASRRPHPPCQYPNRTGGGGNARPAGRSRTESGCAAGPRKDPGGPARIALIPASAPCTHVGNPFPDTADSHDKSGSAVRAFSIPFSACSRLANAEIRCRGNPAAASSGGIGRWTDRQSIPLSQAVSDPLNSAYEPMRRSRRSAPQKE